MKDAGLAEGSKRSGIGYWIRHFLWWLATTLFTLWLSIAGVQIINAAGKVPAQSQGMSGNIVQPADSIGRPATDR